LRGAITTPLRGYGCASQNAAHPEILSASRKI
jgi:hypothetical protein